MDPAAAFEGVVRGRWLHTGKRVLERGGILVRASRVAEVLSGDDRDPRGAPVLDLPRALLHPGLLNAHAHLDLTGLLGEIPPGLPFARWLDRVRQHRLRAGEEGLREASRAGVRALLESGCTRLVDFSYGGLSEDALRQSGLRVAVLREVIGPDPRRACQALAAARDWLRTREPHPLLIFGLAPHSPYLATPGLIRRCRVLCVDRPFSTHACELPGEAELLREGTGELRDFLASVGVPPSCLEARGAAPLELLDRLGALQGTLIVHANHLQPSDPRLLARSGASVVFCPRSHRYFERPSHPLRELLSRGVPVALGTDSAASNVGLSVAGEMREARRQFPELPGVWFLAMGTGALLPEAARLPGSGFLDAGAPADLAAAELPPAARDPLEAFLGEEVPNVLTLVGGKAVFRAP